jgi:hypothetical protein
MKHRALNTIPKLPNITVMPLTTTGKLPNIMKQAATKRARITPMWRMAIRPMLANTPTRPPSITRTNTAVPRANRRYREKIERFYAKRLPLSKEPLENLRSFGAGAIAYPILGRALPRSASHSKYSMSVQRVALET